MIDTDPDDRTLELSRNIPHLEADIRDGFDDIEAQLGQSPELSRYALPEVQADREELEAVEKDFVDKVLAAIEAVDDKESPLVLQFDIDETLVKKIADEAGTDVVRPAVRPLVRYLKKKYEDRLRLGLLSSRGQEYVEAFGASDVFKGVDGEPLLDQEYVESSRDGRILNELESGGKSFRYIKAAEVIERIGGYLSPEAQQIVANTDPTDDSAFSLVFMRRYRLGGLQDPKLSIVCEHAKQHPDTTFIMVDDFPIIEVLGSNKVHGVSLYEKGRFSLR